MKLRVLPGKFLHEEVNGRMGHFKAGTVFEHPDEKRAQRLLDLIPAQVEKAPDEPVTPKVVSKDMTDKIDQKPGKPGKSSKGG